MAGQMRGAGLNLGRAKAEIGRFAFALMEVYVEKMNPELKSWLMNSYLEISKSNEYRSFLVSSVNELLNIYPEIKQPLFKLRKNWNYLEQHCLKN